MKRDDTLWKAILEDVFDDFLWFFYPNADEIFDLHRGFEFLDKELDDLFPPLETEKVRYVDKLVKVWLKDGTEEWILIHIEVQGYPQQEFTERMFTYQYRIRDKYHRKVVAWAILSDKSKKFVPNRFEESFMGTTMVYEFNTYKILHQDETLLKQSNNPFAIVVLTVLLALKKTQKNELSFIDLKLELIKHLISKNIAKVKIRALMNFLKHYVRFNTENTRIFEEKLEQITGKSYPMGIEQFLLQRAEMTGEKKGEKKGEKRGEKKHLRIVIQNAYLNGLSLDVISKIVALDETKVKAILVELGLLK